MKTVYIAFDGTTFDNDLECLDYEENHSFKQLSSNCVFLDENGKLLSYKKSYESPDCIFGMYVPTLKDAEIIHDRCIECGADSPWGDKTFESISVSCPSFFWFYQGWKNIDEMINYWTEMKKIFYRKEKTDNDH